MVRLRIGSQGPLVKKLQEALKAAGFYEGVSDEAFGERTLRARCAFQENRFGSGGDDGIAGPITAAAMKLAWPKQA